MIEEMDLLLVSVHRFPRKSQATQGTRNRTRLLGKIETSSLSTRKFVEVKL